jgi:hypothetical protein
MLNSSLLYALAHIRNKTGVSPTNVIKMFLALMTDLQISDKSIGSDCSIRVSLIESLAIIKILQESHRYCGLVNLKRMLDSSFSINTKQAPILYACLKSLVILCLDAKADVLILLSYLRSQISSSRQSDPVFQLVTNECIVGILSISNENLDIACSYIINLVQENSECELIKHRLILYFNALLKNIVIIRNRVGVRLSRKIYMSLHHLIVQAQSLYAFHGMFRDLFVSLLHLANKKPYIYKTEKKKTVVYGQRHNISQKRVIIKKIAHKLYKKSGKQNQVKTCLMWSWFNFKNSILSAFIHSQATHQKEYWCGKQKKGYICSNIEFLRYQGKEPNDNSMAKAITVSLKQIEKNHTELTVPWQIHTLICNYQELSYLPSKSKNWFTPYVVPSDRIRRKQKKRNLLRAE